MAIERYPLDAECELRVWRAWLPLPAAEAQRAELGTQLPWEQRSVHLFGRWVPQPRLIAWGGTVPYRYSGLTLEPRALHPRVAQLVAAVNEQTEIEFNHVLLNRYRDGNDSMGWHSDDEAELGDDPPIASLSLGEPRDFLLRAKAAQRNASGERKPNHCLRLGCGDLLLMNGATQRRYVHALPKRRSAAGERISLTFRRVLRAPSIELRM